MYKKFLVPTDGSPRSELAVERAVALAKKLGAEVTIIHVTPSVSPLLVTPYAGLPSESLKTVISELEKNGAEILDRLEQKYAHMGLQLNTKMLDGEPASAITSEAQEGGYDLIIMANRGHGAVKEFLMGSVSHRVVKHAGCTVMIVK